MAILRRFRLYLLPITLCATSIVAISPLTAQASGKSLTTTSLLSAAKAALSKQTSVHIVVNSKSGKVTNTVIVDIAKTSGTESIISGTKTITITLTPTYAYLRGSASGLMAIMGLTAAQEKIVGSKSVSMKAGTTPYNNFKANLTTAALLTMLPVTKGTTSSTTTFMNKKAYLLSWSTKASGTSPATKSVLKFSATGPTLPLGETVTSTSGSGSTTFSRWGEAVAIVVPPSSSLVSYTKLFG